MGLRERSFEPAAGVDFLRTYHRINPRLKDLVKLPLNGWYSCEEHFTEAEVAADRYYTEYLIPYGGRYCYAGKIFEDETSLAIVGAITRVGQPPMSAEEKQAFTRLAEHFSQAFDIGVVSLRKPRSCAAVSPAPTGSGCLP